MPWESVGSISTGSGQNDRAWVEFGLRLAKRYIDWVCGDPPMGNELNLMSHDHELGAYPSLGIWSEYTPDQKYVSRCERALEVFNGAVDWHSLKEHFESEMFGDPEEDEG